MLRSRSAILAAAGAILAFAIPVRAQDTTVPYWVSLRDDRANMRVGPSDNFRIEWVYVRRGLPLKVVRMQEGWRLVEDPDGVRGWIVARLLTRDRSAIVTGAGPADLRAAGQPGAALRWRVEPGVVGRLGECAEGWCTFDAAGHAGWIRETRLWGAGAP